MRENDPFSLTPNQDLSNGDKFSLIRDNPGTGQTSDTGNYGSPTYDPYRDNGGNMKGGYNDPNMPAAGYGYNGSNMTGAGYGYNGSNMPAAGYGYNGSNMPGAGYENPGNRSGTGNPISGVYETVQQLESLRKSIYSKWILIAVITGVALIVCFLIMMRRTGSGYLRSTYMPFLLALVFLAPGLIIAPGISSKKKKLKELYKETFVIKLLQQHFTNVMYDWKGGFSETQVRQSGLSRTGNRYHTEDYISAVWNGVHFEQADVKIQYHTSSGKSSHTVTYFEGRMFVFEYSRKMTLPIQIHSKSFRYAGTPDYGLNLQKVQMEDVAFNKRFVIKSTSPHDAFYVLTPQMMQRITQLEQTYGRITMVICNGKLYIGLDNRIDSFDPQIMKPIDYTSEKERIKKDVQVIEDLIQILNCLP